MDIGTMINKIFKKSNILFKAKSKTYSGQESFSIIFVLSDIYKMNKDYKIDIQDFSVNTYKNNTERNSLFFTPQSLWLRSQYAAECKDFKKLKNKNHILKLAFDALFNEIDND